MVFVGDISTVNGIINQLITGGAPPCIYEYIYMYTYIMLYHIYISYLFGNDICYMGDGYVSYLFIISICWGRPTGNNIS